MGLRLNKYYYLKTGLGCNRHRYHPKPQPGALALHLRHMEYCAQKLSTDAGKSAASNNTSRYLVKENQDHYISKSTMQVLQAIPECLTEEEDQDPNATATMLMNWPVSYTHLTLPTIYSV